MTIGTITISVAFVWLVLMVILMSVEALTLGLTCIWFAAGALIAFLAALLGLPFWLQVILFLVVSTLLVIFTKPIVKDKLKVGAAKTGTDELIGKTAVVITDITEHEAGRVKISGMEWSAITKESDLPIKEGEKVMISSIEGVKLIVTRA